MKKDPKRKVTICFGKYFGLCHRLGKAPHDNKMVAVLDKSNIHMYNTNIFISKNLKCSDILEKQDTEIEHV